MEFSSFQHSSWPLFFGSFLTPENHVHWAETPESHIYTADLPGVRKQEIKVEVEDSRYLIIRTETVADEATEPVRRSFMRKFRLPGMVDLGGISAGYEDGVLTVTVPRSFAVRRLRIHPAELPERHEILAPAA